MTDRPVTFDEFADWLAAHGHDPRERNPALAGRPFEVMFTVASVQGADRVCLEIHRYRTDEHGRIMTQGQGEDCELVTDTVLVPLKHLPGVSKEANL